MADRDRRFLLTYSPEVPQDIRNLPTSRLRKIALLRLQNLVTGEERGPIMDEDGLIHDLGGIRRLYFEERPDRRRGADSFRIVYRELAPAREGDLPTIHVIAIGPRKAMEAYLRAAQRLGRSLVIDGSHPLEKEAARLSTAGRRHTRRAKGYESAAASLQTAIDRGNGPAEQALKASTKTSPEALLAAQETDIAAVQALLRRATKHRQAAVGLRAEARQLRERIKARQEKINPYQPPGAEQSRSTGRKYQ